MNPSNTLNLALRFFSLLMILGLTSCDLFREKDRDPIVWNDEDLNDFVVYAYAPSGRSFAVIDLSNGQVIKILEGLDGIQSVLSSRDGLYIYISTFKLNTFSGNIFRVRTDSWDYEIIYDRPAHLLDNRNGGIFFITKQADPLTGYAVSDRIFGEIEPSTGAITSYGSIDVNWGAWYDDRLIEIHPFKPLLYAVDGSGKLYSHDYTTSLSTYIFPELPFPPLARFSLSGGGDSLFIPGGPVLDLNRNAIAGTIPVWRLGSAVTRRDNKEVYITDPGGYWIEPYSQRKLFVFSPMKKRVTSTFDVGSMTENIQMTPKERFAVVNDWNYVLIVVDLKTRKVVARHNTSPKSSQGFYLAPKPPSLKYSNI